MSANPPSRGTVVQWIWLGTWAALLLLLSTQVVDAWQRSVPAFLLFFWFAPLLILIPGMVRDGMRSYTWLAFISLMYFVFATLRIFAEPDSGRAQAELFAVILLFLCSMFYVRQRSRELQASRDAGSDSEV
ncbi:DUF2069 domain-containing protein [Congregibacter litoralis]|uniref:Putative membrane protein n=1 Tax=Congregibacter litoralis KT71 TaxID=314285 RepID=A4ACK2_9GAMM|nr:DUF2069 domain-containing protein [Congregibacter litoralis]EAQ96216.1 putative membrane protein [Congregibacter litoralis KT71]